MSYRNRELTNTDTRMLCGKARLVSKRCWGNWMSTCRLCEKSTLIEYIIDQSDEPQLWRPWAEMQHDAYVGLEIDGLMPLSHLVLFHQGWFSSSLLGADCVSQFCGEQCSYFNRGYVKSVAPSGGVDILAMLIYLVPRVVWYFFMSCQVLSFRFLFG